MAKRHWNREGDLESLFVRLEELVLANSGEDEFEEVFKLLIAKLWDERSGKASRFNALSSESDTFDAICGLLREAEKGWPGILGSEARPNLTPEHLQVCVEALARHSIGGNDLQVLDGFFEFLVSRGAKGSKGQYFTPRHVVDLCVRMLQPTKEEIVCDPGCGSGGFLLHALSYVRENEQLTEACVRQYCRKNVWGFDIDGRAVRVAKALMLLAGDEKANIIRLNSLLRPDMGGLFPVGSKGKKSGEPDSSLTIEDVCRSQRRRHAGFDVILTNPPFAGEVREQHILDGYEVSRGKSRVERDVLFIERCVELLRPGGRLAIVLPHNKFAGSAFHSVREWVLDEARILGAVGLGRNTFLPHTHQKASVLFLQRRKKGERASKDERIFFGISEKEGKDSKGRFLLRDGGSANDGVWLCVDHDFEKIVAEFREFMEEEASLVKA
jgi:type I restriction enzyme M protein